MDLTPGEDQKRSDEKECCEGEEIHGDPRGLHTFDCPVYQANVEAFAKASGWTQAEAQARVVAGDLPGLRKVGWRLVLIRRLDRYFARRRAAVSSERIVEAIAPIIIQLLEDQGRVAYRAGREDWARGVVGYRYVGPDGREMLLDPADVTIVRSENQQPRTPVSDVTP